MKSDAIYESHISTVRWLVYDVPGNVGWIMYLVCLIQCFVMHPEFMEIPLVLISLLVGILPAVAMVVGIAELISERILRPNSAEETAVPGLRRPHTGRPWRNHRRIECADGRNAGRLFCGRM